MPLALFSASLQPTSPRKYALEQKQALAQKLRPELPQVALLESAPLALLLLQ
jgi:hypothetical protein